MAERAGAESALERSSVGHVPAGERWAFDDDVTDVFDDMLRRSIPLHQVMRDAVADMAAAFLQRDRAIVVDLGASRGDALAGVLERASVVAEGIAAEVSPPMLEALRARWHPDSHVEVVDCDLRTDYPVPRRPASVTLAVLTLQFVPVEYRQHVLADAFRSTAPGGCLLVVEKVLGQGPVLDRLFTELYLARKAANGYSGEAIERKRLALEGVLVPLTPAANVAMMQDSGWRQIDCFWRWMNFAAWVAIKEG